MGSRNIVPMAVGLALVLSVAVGCGAANSTAPKTTMGKGVTNVKKRIARTWHVGGFTVATHLLPTFYDPNGSWNFVDLEPSAVYYVPEATPTELLGQSLSSGQTHVVARVDCAATWQGLQTEVRPAGGSNVLVQCGSPPSGKLLQGILVDVTTGAAWTLWTNGQVGSDGAMSGEAVVSRGWVYFETFTLPGGRGLEREAMNLATRETWAVPFPLSAGQVWTPARAPDGTLYATWGGWWNGQELTPIDIYRVVGTQATLVAHLPGGGPPPEGLSIGTGGTIWVTKPGGSLTPDAGPMTIKGWDATPAPPNSTVLWAGVGNGYTLSLGAKPSPGIAGPVQVTLDTPQGPKTIVVGEAAENDTHLVPDGASSAVVFPAPQGGWQVVTVSGG